MAFPPTFLDELLARTDLVDLVARFVVLTKKGGRFWGCCPFHAEKTPSFTVSPEKQLYHCFGCGAGGGAIQFVMQSENIDFPSAVRTLSEAAGLPFPEEQDSGEMERRRRLFALNRAAAAFYHGRLPDSPGAAYAVERGLSPAVIKRFGIGFAPDAWDSLIRAMVGEGFDKADLVSVGLVRAGGTGGLYDFFRNRLILPIVDPNKRVLGFSGRRIDGEKDRKYINSPDSLVFLKRRHLFALGFARKSHAKQWILCEGPLDVIALHQAGFDSAVASQGTSLTDDHARLIARHTKEVVIAYDTDTAGQAATARAMNTLEKAGLTVRVLQLSDAKDPDEFIGKYGRDAFSALLAGAEGHMEFRLLSAAKKHDLGTDEGRVAFLREGVSLLLALDSPAARAVYQARLAEMAGVSAGAIEAEWKLAFAHRQRRDRSRETRAAITPAVSAQPAERGLRYEDLRSAKAEEGLLTLLFSDPDLAESVRLALVPEDFSSPFLGRVFGEICQSIGEGRPFALAAAGFGPGEMSRLTELAARPVSTDRGEQAVRDYVRIILDQRDKRRNTDPLAARLKIRGIGGEAGPIGEIGEETAT